MYFALVAFVAFACEGSRFAVHAPVQRIWREEGGDHYDCIAAAARESHSSPNALKALHLVATRVILPQFRTVESSSLSVHA